MQTIKKMLKGAGEDALILALGFPLCLALTMFLGQKYQLSLRSGLGVVVFLHIWMILFVYGELFGMPQSNWRNIKVRPIATLILVCAAVFILDLAMRI